jgi:hypothetical protein
MIRKKITFVLLSGLLLLCFNCRNEAQRKEKSTAADPAVESDGSSLFDGKTLNGWEVTNFGPQGAVYVSGGELILSMGDGCTGVTYTKEFPEMNYKVTLDAKRVSGNDFFCGMTFPVGLEPCTLIVGGWGGTVVGLSSIDGYDAAENETTTTMVFEKDQWYNICLVVKNDSIKAYINNELMVDFYKGSKHLSVRPEVELSRPFGIATWHTTGAIKNIKLELME